MLITLINPPSITNYASDMYIGRSGGPPLNLAYLANVIEKVGREYDIIDCMAHDRLTSASIQGFNLRGLPVTEAVDAIDPQSTVVGITSMFTCEWIVVRELAKAIKVRYPDMTIIIGGEHASCDAENIIKYEDAIDFCFKGEAEASLEFFLTNFDGPSRFETPGILFRNAQGEVVINPPAKRLTKIDDFFPQWDKIPVDYYLDRKLSYTQLGKRAMPLLATRGCPYACTFCSNEMMWGNRYVMRSPESIVKEMKVNIARFGAEHFDFVDLATSINKKWFESLLILIRDEVPGISWEMTVGTRSEILDRDILRLMQESGNNRIGYAPETGSLSMAEKINKRLNFEKFYRSVHAAVDLGLDVRSNIIIGFPHETLRELLATLFFALKLGWHGVKGVSIFKFTPLYGTILAKEYFPPRGSSLEHYEKDIEVWARHNMVKIVNPLEIFSNPKDQLYAFLSNGTMVLSYFVCLIRRPKYIKDFFRNIRQGTPQYAVEVATHMVLKKVRKMFFLTPDRT